MPLADSSWLAPAGCGAPAARSLPGLKLLYVYNVTEYSYEVGDGKGAGGRKTNHSSDHEYSGVCNRAKGWWGEVGVGLWRECWRS